MKEERTGGGREFIFSVVWAAILLIIGRTLTLALTDYKIIGVLITILMYCILGFFVLTRYAAVYTLTLDDGRVRIVRAIGHRVKTVDFALSQIRIVQRTRPKTNARAQIMRQSVFSQRHVYYIEYEKNGEAALLICDMSQKMADRIKKEL